MGQKCRLDNTVNGKGSKRKKNPGLDKTLSWYDVLEVFHVQRIWITMRIFMWTIRNSMCNKLLCDIRFKFQACVSDDKDTKSGE